MSAPAGGSIGTGGTGVPASDAAGIGSGGASGAAPGAGSGGMPSGSGAAAGAGGSGGADGSMPAGSGGTAANATTGSAKFDVHIELASDVDPAAPGTIGIVTWSVDVDGLIGAYLEFGLDTTYGTKAPVDLSLADHRTLLLGMKPSRTYHVRVVAMDGAATYASDDYTVETGPPTDLVTVSDFHVVDAAAREPGFIVASHRQNSSVAFILDPDGEVVWWYAGGPNGIARARMSEDGQSMWIAISGNVGAPLVRVSMDTLQAQTYQNTVASHDITPVGGATMAYIDYSETDCNSIYEIDPSGTTHEVFESQGVVSATAGALGCHGNALRYSKKEDVYTFSDLNQDVLVVGRDGSVQWRLSERVSGGNAAWGGEQHGHQLLDDSMLIFANSGAGTSASAAIEYDLDGNELKRFPSGGFTANLGDVQRLPGGNTLITYSNDSLIQEVDAQGNLVLEVRVDGSSLAYSLWRESLYGPPPDILQ